MANLNELCTNKRYFQDYDGKLPVVTNEVKHKLWEYNTTDGDNGHICRIWGKCNAKQPKLRG